MNTPTNNPDTTIAWDQVHKKEARGTDDYDFGEVQEAGSNYVRTQRGLVNREQFYLPKYLVQGYDGHTLWFDTTEQYARDHFMKEAPPTTEEYSTYRKPEMPTDIETRIPVIEERLNVSKKMSTGEATIVKEPVTETKTVEVPVTHEELRVERRPADEAAATTGAPSEGPVQSKTEIKVPLNREEVQVTKQPYVKEEVIVEKEPVTETQTVSDTVTSEKVDVSGAQRMKDERKVSEAG